jgi:hypothetical protein
MLDTILSSVMKRGFHILCSRRNDTKLVLATRLGKAGGGIQLKSAFAPDERKMVQSECNAKKNHRS